MATFVYYKNLKKLELLEKHKIALWDICFSCKRKKSADSSIQDIVVNNIPEFLKENPSIQTIVCNGKTSYEALKKFYPEIECVVCSSTSSANARKRIEDLVIEYKGVLK